MTLGALEPPERRRAVIQEMKTICHGREPCSRQPHLVSVAVLDPSCCLWRKHSRDPDVRGFCFPHELNKNPSVKSSKRGRLTCWLSGGKEAPRHPIYRYHRARSPPSSLSPSPLPQPWSTKTNSLIERTLSDEECSSCARRGKKCGVTKSLFHLFSRHLFDVCCSQQGGGGSASFF